MGNDGGHRRISRYATIVSGAGTPYKPGLRRIFRTTAKATTRAPRFPPTGVTPESLRPPARRSRKPEEGRSA